MAKARNISSIVVLGGLGVVAMIATAWAGEANPPADGFNESGSDARAIEIADATMEAMGGRAAWDGTRVLTWRFFGRRLHVWDKWSGDFRVEYRDRESGDAYIAISNLSTGEGQVWRNGEALAGADLEAALKRARSLWINDSYWLFMPYKLKDTGVTLRYLGEGATEAGRPADMLELTFQDVGDTPQNKYHVWVARDSGLVEQWAYFADASDPEPGFVIPWGNWRRHGEIMLSDDRGEGRAHTDVAVLGEAPEGAFSSPEPLTMPNATSTD